MPVFASEGDSVPSRSDADVCKGILVYMGFRVFGESILITDIRYGHYCMDKKIQVEWVYYFMLLNPEYSIYTPLLIHQTPLNK